MDTLLQAAHKSLNKDEDKNIADTTNTERLMDSGELEMERGITITSKVTRLDYLRQGSNNNTNTNSPNNIPTVLNVVDTPGHADFAGEVDRILGMVDGVCLVVDAREGPMAQTKYVLSRALRQHLNPIVVLNKCDRPDAISRLESGEVENELFDLFASLGADDDQLEYPTIYASAKSQWATQDVDLALKIARGEEENNKDADMAVLLDAMMDYIPEPRIFDGEAADEEHYKDTTFAMTATTVGYDQYLGRLCTGRIFSGSIRSNDAVVVVPRECNESLGNGNSAPSNIAGIFVNRGISRTALETSSPSSFNLNSKTNTNTKTNNEDTNNDIIAAAGDIVTLAGIPNTMKVGDTLTSAAQPIQKPIDTPPLAPPTLSVDFGANSGPLSGQEGSIVTASRVRDRLYKETDNNVTISVTKSDSDAEKTVVFGRGELQIGILIEQMRREGYEFTVSPPRILTSVCEQTQIKLEPFEEATVDVDEEYSGTVVNALTGNRKGILMEMVQDKDGKCRLVFEVPSRGLLGFGPEIATATRGTAVVNHCFLEHRAYAGMLGDGLEKGKLISKDNGKTTLYALSAVAERGTLFIAPGDVVYPGMVIGESSRSGDLEVNPVRAKETTNFRTVNKDEKLTLPPAKKLSVEELIGYMSEDEIIEVTPLSVRLRKAELDSGARARASRSKKKKLDAVRNNNRNKK